MNTHEVHAVGPYGHAAATYWAAGWRGILPLPEKRKASPPSGWTGRDGAWPTRADIAAWEDGEQAWGNLGLRLPRNVIGIDVDNYSGKLGEGTLAEAVGRWGDLPPTWISTSRADGISGIRLFTAPEGLAWPGEVGPGIELILFNHRYCVAWPSVHPSGAVYRWIEPGGPVVATGRVPRVDELSALPAAWVDGLTGGRAFDDSLHKSDLDLDGVLSWLAEHGGGEPCQAMASTVERYRTTRLVGESSRHDAARDAVARLVFMASEGHTGARAAIDEIGHAFREAIEADGRGRMADRGEWQRIVEGAVRLAASDDLDRPTDPCTYGATPIDMSGYAPSEPPPPPTESALAAAHRLAVEAEARRQRVMRDARRTLDDEDAARVFRVPPSRADLAAELAMPDEPITYAVDALLPTGANALLTAQFKAGKTTLINHLARCFADGERFLGRYAVGKPAGRVGLFNYEVGEGMYRRWLREVGIVNTSAVAPLNLRGYALPLTSPRVADWLVGWLVEHEVTVWIVDPFARAFTGESENDNSDVGRFLETLDVIKSRAGVTELVLPTHTGRAEFEVGAERARGATRLDDWADVRWMLTRDSEGARYFSATGRDVEISEAQLTYSESTRALAYSGEGDRRTAESSSLGNRILAVIQITPDLGVREIYAAVKAKKTAIDDTLADLVESGRVAVTIGANRKHLHRLVGPVVVPV